MAMNTCGSVSPSLGPISNTYSNSPLDDEEPSPCRNSTIAVESTCDSSSNQAREGAEK